MGSLQRIQSEYKLVFFSEEETSRLLLVGNMISSREPGRISLVTIFERMLCIMEAM